MFNLASFISCRTRKRCWRISALCFAKMSMGNSASNRQTIKRVFKVFILPDRDSSRPTPSLSAFFWMNNHQLRGGGVQKSHIFQGYRAARLQRRMINRRYRLFFFFFALVASFASLFFYFVLSFFFFFIPRAVFRVEWIRLCRSCVGNQQFWLAFFCLCFVGFLFPPPPLSLRELIRKLFIRSARVMIHFRNFFSCAPPVMKLASSGNLYKWMIEIYRPFLKVHSNCIAKISTNCRHLWFVVSVSPREAISLYSHNNID